VRPSGSRALHGIEVSAKIRFGASAPPSGARPLDPTISVEQEDGDRGSVTNSKRLRDGIDRSIDSDCPSEDFTITNRRCHPSIDEPAGRCEQRADHRDLIEAELRVRGRRRGEGRHPRVDEVLLLTLEGDHDDVAGPFKGIRQCDVLAKKVPTTQRWKGIGGGHGPHATHDAPRCRRGPSRVMPRGPRQIEAFSIRCIHETEMPMTVRIGILGAARIAPAACLRPARAVDGVEVVAVAARDSKRAEAFASKHSIGRVLDSYQQLIDDPDIDAVYNPLPNGLHGYWTLQAIAAGKHVLCEKPFAANVAEATAVTEAIEAQDKVVMEAFHYRYHPMMQRTVEILTSGELGTIERVETAMCIPLPMRHDIRYQLDLAGGASMDIGCYAVNLWRVLAGAEPVVTSATAKTISTGMDRAMSATLQTESGVSGTLECSLLSSKLFRLSGRVHGSEGSLSLFNPLGPQFYNRMKVTHGRSSRVEHFERTPTYTFQMEAFRDAVMSGTAFPTTPRDSINTMAVIDAMYRASGLPVREPTSTR